MLRFFLLLLFFQAPLKWVDAKVTDVTKGVNVVNNQSYTNLVVETATERLVLQFSPPADPGLNVGSLIQYSVDKEINLVPASDTSGKRLDSSGKSVDMTRRYEAVHLQYGKSSSLTIAFILRRSPK